MKNLLILASFIAIAFANVNFEEYTAIMRRDGTPIGSGWTILRKSDPQQKVTFTISLQQQNLDKLEQRFWVNSDPTNPAFAKVYLKYSKYIKIKHFLLQKY